MATIKATSMLPAITISMRDDHTVSVIIPDTSMRSMMIAHHLAAECCEHRAERGELLAVRYPEPVIKVERMCVSMCIDVDSHITREATTRYALALVQRLDGAVPKYARDEVGMATHRTIIGALS
jgi:hypothetical protein